MLLYEFKNIRDKYILIYWFMLLKLCIRISDAPFSLVTMMKPDNNQHLI